uniref:Uncharacterized protein n=1 Tax=Plectus sambesii TaxID=2011161 RepID=A0A914XSW1_9BILA
MSKHSALFLFFAAIIPGVVDAFGEKNYRTFVAIPIVIYIGIICVMVYCLWNWNSQRQRMMRLQERMMKAQTRHLENAPSGTVFPVQQMAVYTISNGVNHTKAPDLDMPPTYSDAVKTPNYV